MDGHSVKKYLLLWAANALIVYTAPFIAPGYVVLGNDKAGPFVSALLSGIIIVFLMTFGMKVASYAVSLKRGSEAALGGVLLVVNTLAIWITARFANYTGFGIASFWVSIALAVIVSALELWIWQMITTSKGEAFPVEPISSLSGLKRSSKKRRAKRRSKK